MENLGLFFALGAALCWGSYMVPFKKSQSKDLIQFQLLMGFGVLISTTIIILLANFSLKLNVYGLIAGLLWAIGNAVSLVAVENLGISKAVPLLSSLVILGSFFWGALVFGELPGIYVATFAIAFVVVGVYLVGSVGNATGKNTKKGILMGTLAGVIFASQFVPVKMVGLLPSQYFFSMGVGIFISAVAFFVFKGAKFSRNVLKEGVLSGVIWNLGNFSFVLAMSAVGLAKGGAISQLAILVAVLWGLFYFKEITGKKDRKQVMIGAAILLVGVALLSTA